MTRAGCKYTPATCEAGESVTYTCPDCGESVTVQLSDPLMHSYEYSGTTVDGNLLPTIEVPFNLNMIRSIRIGPKCRERKNEIMALMAFSFDRVAEDGLNGHASEPSHYLGEVLMSGEKHEDGWWDNTT